MAGVEGRTAVITGGARGIGAATAQRLAQAGAKVAVLDLNEEAAKATAADIEAKGGRAIGLRADVTDRDRVTEVMAEIADTLGSIDILMNNAGVLRDRMLFKMTDDDWDLVMNVHLKGAFLATQAAQGYMVKQGYGRVISMSSISADGNRGRRTTPRRRRDSADSLERSRLSWGRSALPRMRSRRASSRRR